jgi:hypothetical protein
MKVCVPEQELHEAWRRSDGRRETVVASDGQRYRVLYAGMPGGSYGPDFRDAVLEARDGVEVVGDVEIHGASADWRRHGHDADPNYGRVVFHAVGETVATGSDTINSLGMQVPEIDIGPLLEATGEPVWREGECGARRKEAFGDRPDERSMRLNEWFDAAGDERFALKVGGRRAEMERFGGDLTLQMAVFEGLGYPRNGAAFRHLARRLPWSFLARFGRCRGDGSGDGERIALALLRWAAGFGDRPEWSPVPRLAGESPRWIAAAGRPANRPEARLEAAAMLVAVWLRCSGPMRHALEAMRRVERSSEFRDAYRVGDGAIGAGRAGEIVVNGVLPTIAAWAEIGRDGELYADAMRLYRDHPSLPSNSVLEEARRVLARRGANPVRLRGARRQLGVIHIFKSMLLRPRASHQMSFGCRALSS